MKRILKSIYAPMLLIPLGVIYWSIVYIILELVK